ncbi:uncharacterized protein [Haliotis cracherodii]|uniref:uncharacterized protein n=1 Tax=Haliotis cracherodii TaxID=6455 RepID=UPI0039EA9C9F
MANAQRAPKQWCLGKIETVNSFENWRQNLLYTLSLDTNFTPFLADGAVWHKKTRATPLRGMTDDGEDVREAIRRTARQKVSSLELMLGQIANYCPIISRNTIIKSSTSVDAIWHAIRLHFGFQATGAHFIDFAEIKLENDERPEDLYQRLMAFVEDNLLRREGGITHYGNAPEEDEELSPSLENFVVLTWLRLIHVELPKLVKQRYGTDLRSRTISSLKPEISQALDSLLDEIRTAEDAKVMRTNTSQQRSSSSRFAKAQQTGRKFQKSCPLCKAAGRSDHVHYLSECKFLPDHDRRYMVKARQIASILDDPADDASDTVENACAVPSTEPVSTLRVQVRQSPYMYCFCGHQTARVTVDSGATGNMIRLSTATGLGADIKTSSQSAHQADGSSPLKVVGETRILFTRDNKEFDFNGLVVENLDVEVLAGIPFMEANDVAVRPAKHQIILGDGTTYTYGSTETTGDEHTVRRACVLRAPDTSTTIWPGDFIEVPVPESFAPSDFTFAIEPRIDTRPGRSTLSSTWPELGIISSVSGKIRIPNLSDTPQLLKKHEHFCQIRPVFIPDCDPDYDVEPAHLLPPTMSPQIKDIGFSSTVCVDPDNILPQDTKSQFELLLTEFDDVFNQHIDGYNGASGPFQAFVNMGPVQPPQRKGRVPQYSRDKLSELQQKFDELERMGVFVRPEDAGIQVEYLNPSFLIKKSSGGYRLVTAFSDVGRYSKPQPSLMPDVDSTLRQIAKWKYIITADLTNAFYQIPLSKESMKYCGVVTPFRGVRVYARSAMGMPGSETALEELMCRVLGDLLEEGVIAKLADDLYCGADSPDELLRHWRRVLEALKHNNLRLSPNKTVIAPRTTTILGWQWHQGSIQASQHRISTLASCSPPETVTGLRSFIGAYKVLSRVIPGCSTLLAPLDAEVGGRQSSEKLLWSDSLLNAFKTAQAGLASNKSIVLPHPDDQLWIVTDGAVRKPGIGATLYVTRSDSPRLAGFFSAKLRRQQVAWLPCEVEALSIAIATKHFSPFIIQSKHKACVLTDSRPCVLAFEKLCRGEFSASPRVSTFLSTVSRYQATIQHLAGSANVPSDFASRNAPECDNPSCQICSFIERTESSVVRQLSIEDIMNGTTRLPFTSRSAWRSLQEECQDLRRTHAHLLQGTRPSKKVTNIRDVKRYLNTATISKDGLLVVRKSEPLGSPRECIVVPRQVLDGVLTALHIQLDHPSAHQLKQVCHRYFFALDLDRSINTVSKSCHRCASLRKTPHVVVDQSTSDPPETVGFAFASDVMRRERQLILVLRECVTSYTAACIITDERGSTLCEALIRLCIEFRPLDGPHAVIRTDPAPGFSSLVTDERLQQHRITLEIGRVKNVNKNPVAEKAIQELEDELVRQDPVRGPTTPTALAIAVARLNTRIRSRGLSSREMWTQRDQFTNCQLPLSDKQLITEQHVNRRKNHSHSEKSKAPRSHRPVIDQIEIGDLVYLHNDRNKTCARNRYLVVTKDGLWCNVRKFVGTQLRNTSYRVKLSECFKVPLWNKTRVHEANSEDTSDIDDDPPETLHQTPETPHIPLEISTPPLPPLKNDVFDDNHPTDISSASDQFDPGIQSSSTSRPSRQRQRPKRFDEYVLDF